MTPTKQRLTRTALASLQSLAFSARPRTAIPAAPRATMLTFKLAEIVMLPSPYAVDRGKLIEHLSITEAGTTRLQGELPLVGAKPLPREQTHG